jgi:glycosyltransferase involved in cell wall biosynthesis
VKFLKILLVTPGLTPSFGGSAVSEASLCQFLEKNSELNVFCRRGKLDRAFTDAYDIVHVEEYKPIEVFRAWLNKKHPLSRAFQILDVIHLNGHWKWENYFWAKLARRHSVPLIFHPRGMLVAGYRKPWTKKVFNLLLGNYVLRSAARIIALSNFEVRQFRLHPILDSQIVVIPNGVTPPRGPVGDIKGDRGEPFFLYLGRIEKRKNLIFLIDAFKKFVEAGGAGTLRLIGPVERGYDREIVRHLKEINLESRVALEHAKYGREKWQLMFKSTAVIYPAWEEPFGRVPFEALSISVPVIVPERSGSAEYLKPSFPHCTYLDSDINSLADQMRWMATEPNQDRTAEVAAAHRWVIERLDWRVVGTEVLQLYQNVIGIRVKPAVASGGEK